MQLRRGIEPLLNQLLDTTKVVILEGGRGVGKTTLVRQVASARGFKTTFDLSDPADRDALARDPHRVLAASSRPILIDEAQLEPELTVAVKRIVDEVPDPGQFLLTGSSRIGRGALGGGDPLAARAVRVRLRSFTQGELGAAPVNVVEQWGQGGPAIDVHEPVSLPDLIGRIVRGGLPAVALAGDGSEMADHGRRLLSNYVDGVLTMTVAGSRANQTRLRQTFEYLAANPGQILNIARAASELGMRAETVRSYLDSCASSFLLDPVAALRPSQHKTITSHPRVFASDTGLAVWAAETSPERLVRDPNLAGSLLENLVAHELAAQAGWLAAPPTLMHWRDSRAGREVDLVLRWPGGETIGVGVKSASTVSMADARGLAAFAEAAGPSHQRSIIVYTGRATQQLDDNIWAVPLASLFT